MPENPNVKRPVDAAWTSIVAFTLQMAAGFLSRLGPGLDIDVLRTMMLIISATLFGWALFRHLKAKCHSRAMQVIFVAMVLLVIISNGIQIREIAMTK